MSSIEISALLKIRTDCFNFTNQLIKLQKLPNSLKNKCVCCKNELNEDVRHSIRDRLQKLKKPLVEICLIRLKPGTKFYLDSLEGGLVSFQRNERGTRMHKVP